MPQNIQAANPTDVMPKFISVAFNEQVRYECMVNQSYPDGSSDRAALVTTTRSFFRATGKLAPTQWKALRDFFWAHIGAAFYFYFPREAQPPFTVDMTGASTDGRYTVVFDGAYAETYTPGNTKADSYGNSSNPTLTAGQSQTVFQLREVE
jgi:hypothetical protein